ncbi:MAG: RidA family protein [Myxococcaceae bacterium]|nr:RidA family protein [Myxococcaceae bacterium]
MARNAIHSDNAPQAIGPYSQAIQVDAGKMTFLSGQIPLDPKSMEMVQGDAATQAERVMQNLKAVLAAAGLDFSHVVRCTIFLTDLGDFAKVNEVYGRYFTAAPPARATVQVAALPRGAKVEIDAIAVS